MSFMKTFTGKKFYPRVPAAMDYDIQDIAHALSHLCRFGGHVKQFYSVAQHSLLVADIIRENGGTADEELWGLLHDATEAYMVDMPSPVKALLPDYQTMEHALMSYIAKALDLPKHRDLGQMPAIVKWADAIALVTEARQLMPGGIDEWPEAQQKLIPHPVKIRNLYPEFVRQDFLTRYKKIKRRQKYKKSA